MTINEPVFFADADKVRFPLITSSFGIRFGVVGRENAPHAAFNCLADFIHRTADVGDLESSAQDIRFLIMDMLLLSGSGQLGTKILDIWNQLKKRTIVHQKIIFSWRRRHRLRLHFFKLAPSSLLIFQQALIQKS